MTRHPENLVAWLDGELHGVEAGAVARHVAECDECARLAADCASVSGLVAAMPQRKGRGRARLISTAVAAGTIAAAVLLGLYLRPPSAVLVRESPVASVRAAAVSQVQPAPGTPPARKRAVRRRTRQVVPPFIEEERAVRIALPAEELFAPGVVPAGAKVYGELILAADGSPQALRLLP